MRAGHKKRVLLVDYCGEHKLEIFECFWLVLESDKQHSGLMSTCI